VPTDARLNELVQQAREAQKRARDDRALIAVDARLIIGLVAQLRACERAAAAHSRVGDSRA
jgi:hypothetical protein